MKKHILGFTIFAFIVGSFISIWALFGYFTQTIPNVPKIESDNLPVFKSDKKRSCFKQQREKISYDVVDSYYIMDENTVVSTLKLKWNGYDAPPKNISVNTNLFSADKRKYINGGETNLKNVFDVDEKVYVTVRSKPLDFMKNSFPENFYSDFDFKTDSGESLTYKRLFEPKQLIVIHGDSSIIDR